MAQDGFKVMDSDMPIVEPADLWDGMDPALATAISRAYNDWWAEFYTGGWSALDAAGKPPAQSLSPHAHWRASTGVSWYSSRRHSAGS